MIVPFGDVVRRAGILGFALALDREGEAASMSASAGSSVSPSSFLIFRGDVHVDLYSVFVVDSTLVAGESAPRLRFREGLGGVNASSMSGVTEGDSSRTMFSSFTSTVPS